MINDDITWCYNECDNMECFRNIKHREGREGWFSLAMLEGTDVCPKTSAKEENPHNS